MSENFSEEEIRKFTDEELDVEIVKARTEFNMLLVEGERVGLLEVYDWGEDYKLPKYKFKKED